MYHLLKENRHSVASFQINPFPNYISFHSILDINADISYLEKKMHFILTMSSFPGAQILSQTLQTLQKKFPKR